MSSPVASLVLAMQRQMSQENEGAPFIDDDQRASVLRGIITGFYAKAHLHQTVIDTNRVWCAKLPLLAQLYPEARLIACVRDVRWIMDSLERVIRANPLEPSRMFNFDPGGTVYSRVAGFSGSDGLVGFALDALREAYFGPQADRILLLTYETLTTAPDRALAAVYDHLGLPPAARDFKHDFENVAFDAEEFDRRLGTPGLHRVDRRVQKLERETVLPPGLFEKFGGDCFWRETNPRGVRIV